MMSIRLLGTAALLLSMTAIVHGETIYKCKGKDGVVAFSQVPCGKSAEQMNIDGRSTYEKASDAKKIWKIAGPAELPSAKACVEAWRPSLKDPESGTLVSESKPGILIKGGSRTVIVSEGRARNGFGGLGAQYFLCDIDAEGTIVGDGNPFGDLRSKAEDIEKYPGLGLTFAFPGVKQ